MLHWRRLAAAALGSVVALLLMVVPAAARSFRCSISAQDYGDVVAVDINPLSPDGIKSMPSSGACFVADDVVAEGSLAIALGHAEHPREPYPTSLKLRLDRPGDVDAIEIWRYRIRYPVRGKMHGFVVARCARQSVTFTLVPHPPTVIGN
jgi:hypothetical protein